MRRAKKRRVTDPEFLVGLAEAQTKQGSRPGPLPWVREGYKFGGDVLDVGDEGILGLANCDTV